jgi:hypothetical protein
MPQHDGISEIYGDLKQLGLFVVSISVLLTIIVSVVAILYGILLYFQKDPHTDKARGIISWSECSKLPSGLYRCSIDVTYTVANKAYVLQTRVDQKEAVKTGDDIKLHYDPADPNDAIVGLTPNGLAKRLVMGGVSMFLVSVVTLWLVRRFKVLQAGQGALVIASLF